MNIDSALAFARADRPGAIQALTELLQFATISNQFPENKPQFDGCTAWLVRTLLRMGFQRAEAMPTGGPDVVYAEWLGAGSAPTLLIYGHYDVMPVDPIEDWTTPPFEPVVDGTHIRARGASDDKGQFFALLCAAEAWLKTGGLPVNLKVLLEGEEEALSRHLEPFILQNRELLRCDGIVIADMGGLDPMIPLVEYGSRGNCSMEISLRGAARDLHSGTYGGAVDNPLNVLTRLLSAIQDGTTRRILVPGFYDPVKALTPRERALLDEIPITDQVGLHLTGAAALGGEEGFALKERISSRPTFDIHGIRGGYTGEGIKTVIPAAATAKISFRLVPDQHAREVFDLVQAYLTGLAPATVQLHCTPLGMTDPATVDLDAPVMQAGSQAFQDGFGVPPRFVRGGGSLPVINMLLRHVHRDILSTGFGLPGDNEHAANENLALTQFQRGTEMMVHFFDRFARLRQA